jgi:UDP-glucose 4-epimerase
MGKILVTGGSGFIGQNLIESLLDAGLEVHCLDLAGPGGANGRVAYFKGSFDDPSVLDKALVGVEYVFHLASATLPKSSNDNPILDISANLQGAVTLLDASVRHKVKKFVFISSGGTVYGVPGSLPVDEEHPTNPLCSYGIVKLAIEKYLRLYTKLYGLGTCSLRLSNPYGKYQKLDTAQGAVGIFLNHAICGEPIEIWGDGSVVRDYVDVQDAVRSMMLCLGSSCEGTEINIGSGIGTNLNQLLDMVEIACGEKVKRIYKPARDFDVPEIYLDIDKADKLLDWRPQVSLQAGLLAMASTAIFQEQELES